MFRKFNLVIKFLTRVLSEIDIILLNKIILFYVKNIYYESTIAYFPNQYNFIGIVIRGDGSIFK